MDKKIKHIPRMDDQFNKCTFCGNCRVVCPTFLVERRESTLCRGRIDLIGGVLSKSSPINISEKFEHDINMCLNCMSCEEICPPKVKVSDLIIAAKADIFSKRKKHLFKYFFKDRIFFTKYIIFKYILGSKNRFRFLLTVYKQIYPFLYNKDLKTKIMGKILLKAGTLSNERKLPKPDFFDYKSFNIEKKDFHVKKRVGLFLGCTGKFLYKERVKHTIKLLNNADIDVLITEDFNCCGAPALYNGDISSAKSIAIKNSEIANRLNQISAIITICGSCGHMIRNEYKKFGIELNIPVYDISEYLIAEKIKVKPRFPDKKVTYHHSCHLLRGMKVKDEPINLLNNAYKKKFISLKEDQKCCGGGGTFSYSYYEIAKKITSEKCENIEKTEADILAVGCPNCSMRIGEQKIVDNKDFEIMHTVELLEVDKEHYQK
ncbi:MAG: hypothetical protein CR982_01180 [Candidatus Cloacimonadota bacterium]|nr:MAG: hypothetical protein CR982_01180 [Candidatus Cloacimonadota bacterium]PIE81257.1 MAG: hypothetical protein CSA15_00960 [Candidatus Delongbacteria bacterium]